MTVVQIREEAQVPVDDDDDQLEHYYCNCDSNRSLCGLDITDATDNTDVETPPEDDCVVCVDLIDTPCRRCGKGRE